MENRLQLKEELLRIYINDHLALAVGASALAKRCRKNNLDSELGRFLDRLINELQEDEEAMRSLIKRIHGSESRAKELTAWLLEKAGRLKLNHEIFRYSDLSRVEELEALILAFHGLQTFWNCLSGTVTPDIQQAGPHSREARAAHRELELRSFYRDSTRQAFLI